MRKDNGYRKGLSKIYSIYVLSGLNQDRFVNAVVKRGVGLYNIKKADNKHLSFCVNVKENKKFFAIINKLWYNNKNCSILDGSTLKIGGGYTLERVKTSGLFAPAYKLWKNVGLIVGAVIFCATAYLSSGLIFSIDYTGSGVESKQEVEKLLAQKGVVRFARFNDFDLKVTTNEILASIDDLSFARCYKRGNRLMVELEKRVSPPPVLNDNATFLTCKEGGVVESVRVYRGNALVSVGERVESGQILVDGLIRIKEEEIQVNVLATVSVICEVKTEILLLSKNLDEQAVILAEQQFSDREIISSSVRSLADKERYIYTVTLQYRQIYSAG